MSEPLIKGAVYQSSTYGPSEYLGVDVFHGETTHHFKTDAGHRYIKPDSIASFLGHPKITTDMPDALLKALEAAYAENGRLRAIVRVNLMRSCGATHEEIDAILDPVGNLKVTPENSSD